MVKLALTIDQTSRKELLSRADRMISNQEPFALKSFEQSIHFLRGVNSRASFCLPAFHLLIAASSAKEQLEDNYPLAISASYIEFSSLNAISLSCRKAFDHANRGLAGAKFAKATDEDLQKHAEYWANGSGRSVEEARDALLLLRELFRICSRTSNVLLAAQFALQKRIGLLKQHADRAAAHLSLESYELDFLDIAHFVAAFCLVGEIIRSFDEPRKGEGYYRQVDLASAEAAKQMFPTYDISSLFGEVNPFEQAQNCWRFERERGLEILLEQIPYAIGRF